MMFLLGMFCGIWICSLMALWMQMSDGPSIDDDSLIVVPQQWGEIE